MTPIAAYLEHRILPNYRNESRKLLRKVARYLILDGIMHRRGFSMPLLRCVNQTESGRLLEEFDSQLFTDFCARHDITKSFSVVLHPQTNGQVEAVNNTRKDTFKKRLEEAKGKWPEKLPEVLWSYRTIERTTTGDSPFALTYGYEAKLPVEVTPQSHRCMTYDQDGNH
ncbi:uncharacterized protein LOC133806037 [Humulus lupulus]|uniref:uncharacterized protein LOC133806037 n=1 Tax=Humulus lupulus TaxID=3486 RepID=UPI002B404290|nr:uncharacterized protein LOC133806037 [Humulus lupulus]